MPSPLAHSAVGYAVATVILRRNNQESDSSFRKNWKFILAAGILSLLPDFDSVVGILLGDFGRFHNNISHSLAFGLGASLLIGIVIKLIWKARFKFAFITVLCCYTLHIVMDFFTYGRGIMLLWPFTSQRYQSDILFFYGFHWSDGLIGLNHIVTLVTESLFIIIVLLVLNFFMNRKNKSTLLIKRASNPEKDGIG